MSGKEDHSGSAWTAYRNALSCVEDAGRAMSMGATTPGSLVREGAEHLLAQLFREELNEPLEVVYGRKDRKSGPGHYAVEKLVKHDRASKIHYDALAYIINTGNALAHMVEGEEGIRTKADVHKAYGKNTINTLESVLDWFARRHGFGKHTPTRRKIRQILRALKPLAWVSVLGSIVFGLWYQTSTERQSPDALGKSALKA